MTFRSKFALLAAGVAISVSPAKAAVFNFNLTGSRSAMFSIDTATVPSFSSSLQSQFSNVAGTFNGVAGVAPTISFGASQSVGDFEIVGTTLGFSQFGGPILISGPTSSPGFIPGAYSLFGIVAGSSTLTIAASTLPGGGSAGLPVPEPASAALLLAGITGLMTFGRRLRRA